MARRYYSRRVQIENKKNQKRAIKLIMLTVAILIAFFLWGLPTIIKLASFIADFRSSSIPISSNDSTPPAPPRFDQIPDVTKDNSIDINGTAEAGSTVVILVDGETIETLSNASGRFSHTFNLRSGENRIVGYAKDLSGNRSDTSRAVVITLDNTPPDLTIIQPENGVRHFGSDNRIDVKGQTESDAAVTLNGSFVLVGNDGIFSKIVSLEEGMNDLKIKSEDRAKNATEVTVSVEYLK